MTSPLPQPSPVKSDNQTAQEALRKALILLGTLQQSQRGGSKQ